MFKDWITYPILAVLIFTGVGQIRYLNRALMRFDSKVVIPVQFVLFTLSAIIGSAILYGDFKTAKFHQVVTFVYGCATTFLGVFIIAWAPSSHPENEEDSIEGSGVEGTATSVERMRPGSRGRNKRASVILPGGMRDPPIVRSPAISLIGLSPAQHLLLVHTPPHDVPMAMRPSGSPERRRTMSWYGENGHENGSPVDARANTIAGRLRNESIVRVGTMDQNLYR